MNIDESSVTEVGNFRVLIYPASRPFSAKESKAITEKLFDFIAEWKAHGKPLAASFKIEKNQFIVIAVDEEKEMASGCSIDSLNGVMREIDAEYQLGLFDRMKACFVENGEVKTMKLQDFRNAIKNQELSGDIQVFDFSKSSYDDFLEEFLLPLHKSWAGMYLG